MRPMKVLNLHSGQQRSVDTGNVRQQTGDQCRTLSGGHGVDTQLEVRPRLGTILL